jgi:hypothetical protein
LIIYILEYNRNNTKEIEDIILQKKDIVKGYINKSLSYLSYQFIKNNKYLFSEFNYSFYLYKNKSLTINNIIEIMSEPNFNISDTIYFFIYANITLKEIIEHNLHVHKNFNFYARNKNCTINDIANCQNYIILILYIML